MRDVLGIILILFVSLGVVMLRWIIFITSDGNETVVGNWNFDTHRSHRSLWTLILQLKFI